MLKNLLTLTVFILLTGFIKAQQIRLLTTGRPVSLRGLSVVSDQIIWVSGSGGSVGLSTDGGKNWKWIQVPRYEKSDFRDIEAFSDQEAVIMGITEPGVILRTIDGGNKWTTLFEDSSKSAFLDAMDFSGDEAVLVGDPEGGKIFFARSADHGKSWNKSNSGFENMAVGEAFFAASGSNIRFIPGGGYALVSGGKKSCLYLPSHRYPLLLNQGKETTGANSIAVNPADPNQAFIVGGDFSHDTARYRNSLRIQFHPFIQSAPLTPPHGYRSCVEYLNDQQMISCGTTGVDFSSDGGLHWKLISKGSFHVCRHSKSGQTVFLAGPHGAIALLEWNENPLK
ncbi:MAG TPA: oxidoreductase [Puia sp.]